MREARWVSAELGDLEGAVDDRLRQLKEVVPRIWARDHTVWREDPAEIADRLGWLDAPDRARRELAGIRETADQVMGQGLTHAVLLGMGGSSLAPEVFRRVFGHAPGLLDLRVLDSTHPDAIVAIERDVPLDRALFIVSSKSGSTIETRSHMDHFLGLVGDASRFVAITDPGSSLERAARERGFLHVFSPPSDVGGRYSALTEFGLVPAALIGADIDGLLDEASAAAEACGPDRPLEENPGALLGAVLGQAALAGRDKCIIRANDPAGARAGSFSAAPLGAWIEQLLAESTGKEGRGILPVDLEPGTTTGRDRISLFLGGTVGEAPGLALEVEEPAELGRAMFVLEFATAVAGHVLGIHPFDQPDVQSAKDRTAELLSTGEVPEEAERDPGDVLRLVNAGDYVAIQAFVAPSDETWGALQDARGRIGERLGVATTLGYGPRYLHSTGQLHKGGPNTGVFLQVFEEPEGDLPVPGRGFTFGQLIEAQAAGDLAALRQDGRRAARVSGRALSEWKG